MTAAEYETARLRLTHDRNDFATTMRASGLELCEDCGWWTNDTRKAGGRTLCGECDDTPPVKIPDPSLFGTGTLEHEMARNLKESR